MTLSDVRLIDPSAKVVHAAILNAFRDVSAHGIAARIPHSKVSQKRVAQRAASEAEGVEFWASRGTIATGVAGQVVVAWWTAVSGRRHVRLLARLVTPETSYLVNEVKMSTRPPVWHVFPERIYRRRMGKSNHLVAVCGCGAIGTERTLGWAGTCCGPCFDYQQEHGELPWKRPALLPTPSPCLAVAASADGRWIAGACTDRVLLWDRDAGTEPVEVFAVHPKIGMRIVFPGEANPVSLPQVALSPNADYLAVAGEFSDSLRVFKLRDDVSRMVVQLRGIETVAFRPRDSTAIRLSPGLFDDVPGAAEARDTLYFISAGRVMIASPPEAYARELAIPNAEESGPLVLSSGGNRLAVRRGDEIHVHESGKNTFTAIPVPSTQIYASPVVPAFDRNGPPLVAFSPDGAQVAIGYHRAIAVHHAATGERRFWDGQLPDQVTGVAFDASGRWLFVGRRDGTLVAHRADIISNERSVVFRWSLGPIRALAACGDTLLTACDEGVQLWPMAKLLEGM